MYYQALDCSTKKLSMSHLKLWVAVVSMGNSGIGTYKKIPRAVVDNHRTELVVGIELVVGTGGLELLSGDFWGLIVLSAGNEL